MPYLTEENYSARYGSRELEQLKQTGGPGGLSVDAAFADASETVDSYLAAIKGRAFSIPLSVPPARIVGVTADIARHELWAQRASEEVRRRYEDAIAYLKDLVRGDAVLNVDAETPPETEGDPSSRIGYRRACTVYSNRTMRAFGAAGCEGDDLAEWRRG